MTAIDPDLRAAVRTPVKTNELVIAPTHAAGDFTSHAVDCPFVFTWQGRLGMTVVGWDGVGYQTGLSWRDPSGRWSRPRLVLPRDASSPHRRYNTALTSILRENGLDSAGRLVPVDGWFYGTYHAYPEAGYEEGSAVIGIVRSRDLVTWEEHGELLRPEDGGEWERGGLYKSWLMRAGGRYWLFYNAKDRATGDWREQTGAAVSDDLVAWTRVSEHPLVVNGPRGSIDDRFASDPCVLERDGTWIMFYFGLSSDGHARDSYAVSTDLVTWTKGEEVLVDVGAPGSIDATHAHKPAVIRHDGRLWHYYCAVSPLRTPVRIGESVQRELRGIAVAHG